MSKLAKFFGNYAVVKKDSALAGLAKILISADLEGASLADLMSYEQTLTKLTTEAAKAKADWEREQKEADVIVAEYNMKLGGINILKEDYAAATDAAEKAEIEATIRLEVAALKALSVDVEREKQEAVDAEIDYKEIAELAVAAKDALVNARANIEKSKKDVERAERDVAKAKVRADRAAELKGLTNRVSGVSVALDVMNKRAEELRIEADALKMKGDLLGADTPTKSTRMQDAMARAAGTAAAPAASVDDLLADLKPM